MLLSLVTEACYLRTLSGGRVSLEIMKGFLFILFFTLLNKRNVMPKIVGIDEGRIRVGEKKRERKKSAIDRQTILSSHDKTL